MLNSALTLQLTSILYGNQILPHPITENVYPITGDGDASVILSAQHITDYQTEGLTHAVQSECLTHAVQSEDLAREIQSEGLTHGGQSEGLMHGVQSEGLAHGEQVGIIGPTHDVDYTKLCSQLHAECLQLLMECLEYTRVAPHLGK